MYVYIHRYIHMCVRILIACSCCKSGFMSGACLEFHLCCCVQRPRPQILNIGQRAPFLLGPCPHFVAVAIGHRFLSTLRSYDSLHARPVAKPTAPTKHNGPQESPTGPCRLGKFLYESSKNHWHSQAFVPSNLGHGDPFSLGLR